MGGTPGAYGIAKILTREHKINRIKSLRHALKELSELASGEGTGRRDCFLELPHNVTNGVGWETDVLEKLLAEGVLKKSKPGLWEVKPGVDFHRWMSRDGMGRLLGFAYIEGDAPAPEAESTADLVPTSWARPAELRAVPSMPSERVEFAAPEEDEETHADPSAGGAGTSISIDHDALVANIEYIREGVDDILNELSKPAPAAPQPTPIQAQSTVSSERFAAIEQGVAGLQKDMGTLTRMVKMAISQWIGEDK